MKTLINSCLISIFAIVFTTSLAQAAEVVSLSASNQVAVNLHTRALAGSCAACHGTLGNAAGGNAANGSAVLAGMDKSYFNTQMLAFKNETRKATVMHHHAKGLSVDEINQLADYFAVQKKISAIRLTTQTLKANHE